MPSSKFRQIFKSQKFLSLFGSSMGAVLGLLSFMLLARTLSKSELGIFALFLTFISVFDMVRNGLVGKPLIKFMAETEDGQRQREIYGSAWALGLKSTLLLGIFITVAFFAIFRLWGEKDFWWYSLYFLPVVLVSLPFNMTTWGFNARLKFDKMLWIKILLQIIYLAGIGIAYFKDYGLEFIFQVYLVANLGSSLLVLIAGWASVNALKYSLAETRKQLYNFGRYSMGSLLGGTLLRSSDIFLIRAFLGPQAVAIYQVPQRLVNLSDIPLRAMVQYYFPGLAQTFKNNSPYFQNRFDRSMGFTFLLLFPLAVVSYVFAEPLVVFLGGTDYAVSAGVMRMFAIFMAISTLDRFAGVALDVVNKPQLNFQKVLLMLSLNIVGDLFAIYFTDDISWVAFVSILTFSGGTVYGFYFLRNYLVFNPKSWLTKGLNECVNTVKKISHKRG